MPTDASPVGALDLPLSGLVVNERIADPVLDALLDYLAYWLNEALNARLAQHTGLKRAAVVCQAVPVGKRFPWNPMEPRAEQFRLDPPCLFLWWAEDSVLAVKEEQFTVCYSSRTRPLRLLWLMPEMPGTDQFILRAGLLAAADAALHKASVRKAHRLYSYGGKPLGTPLAECIAPFGMFDWKYVGGKPSRWGLNDDDPTGMEIAPGCKRDWPCLVGVLTVTEKIADMTFADPGDVTGDVAVSIDAASDSLETLHMMDRWLDAPDGSELEGTELDLDPEEDA